MTPAKDSSVVHQTLHGYEAGHRLLQSSRKLSADEERLMFVLSDMSGSSMIGGFEEYLTGYPIVSSGAYAFARTWYAPEMIRPGCVWTHTLLLDGHEALLLEHLGALLALFKRPRLPIATVDYSSALPLSSALTPYEDSVTYPMPLARRALSALYATPDRPVLIAADNARELESLLVDIWSQQWPALRCAFSFSSGSLAAREVRGSAFDLQVVPSRRASRIEQSVAGAVTLEADRDVDVYGDGWLDCLADDLRSRTSTPLRRFMNVSGNALGAKRRWMIKLANIYSVANSLPRRRRRVTLAPVTRALAESFPGRSHALSLKAELFGSEADRQHGPLSGVSEAQIMAELVSTQYSDVFDVLSLGLERRIVALLKSDLPEALRIFRGLVSHELTHFGRTYVAVFLASADVPQLTALLQSDSLLARGVLDDLLDGVSSKYSHDINKRVRGRIKELLSIDGLGAIGLVTSVLSPFIVDKTWSDDLTDAIAQAAFDEFGGYAAAAILEGITTSGWEEWLPMDSRWVRETRQWPASLVKWLSDSGGASVRAVAFVASLLDPHSRVVSDVDCAVWLRVSQDSNGDMSYEERVAAMAFLLTLGLGGRVNAASKLVAAAFEPVYFAAAAGRLSEDSWQLIRSEAPDLSWWQDWDRCKRLRRALVDFFVLGDWPAADFISAVRDPDVFKQLLVMLRKSIEGRRFASHLSDSVQRGLVEVATWQRRLLVDVGSAE